MALRHIHGPQIPSWLKTSLCPSDFLMDLRLPQCPQSPPKSSNSSKTFRIPHCPQTLSWPSDTFMTFSLLNTEPLDIPVPSWPSDSLKAFKLLHGLKMSIWSRYPHCPQSSPLSSNSPKALRLRLTHGPQTPPKSSEYLKALRFSHCPHSPMTIRLPHGSQTSLWPSDSLMAFCCL